MTQHQPLLPGYQDLMLSLEEEEESVEAVTTVA